MTDKKQEIEERLSRNKKRLKELENTYLKAFSPDGYKKGTSYNDYDTIRGSKKELRVEEFYDEKRRILVMIELDEKLLKNLEYDVDTDEYLYQLTDVKDKVKFLLEVKGYTQTQVAEKLGLSVRYIQKIKNGYKEKQKEFVK